MTLFNRLCKRADDMKPRRLSLTALDTGGDSMRKPTAFSLIALALEATILVPHAQTAIGDWPGKLR
jgi:hypothetical protein